MPSSDLNRTVVEQAERFGFDFALSMIKLCGYGGPSGCWDHNLDLEALAWRDGQAGNDTVRDAIPVAGRFNVGTEKRLPTNMGTLAGSFAKAAGLLNKLSEEPGGRIVQGQDRHDSQPPGPERQARWIQSSSSAMLRRFALNTTSNRSPSNGTAPPTTSTATFTSIRPSSAGGAPRLRASLTI